MKKPGLVKKLFKGKQKPIRSIEDLINEDLSGDMRENALDYVAYLKANGKPPSTIPHIGDGPNGKSYVYGISHGVMVIEPGRPGWGICIGGWNSALLRSEYQNFPADEKVKEFAWEHVRICQNYKTNGKECGCGAQPGRRVSLFGKKINNVCNAIVDIDNPSGETLELTKRLTDVWEQSETDMAKNDKPCALKENEWHSVKDIGAHMGHPLGKAYTKSLDVEFYFTPRHRYTDAAVAFSGGGWVPAAWEQIPLALRIGGHYGHGDRFEACKGPKKGWTADETLRYQANVTYFVEMSINIKKNTYSAMVWMLDADGERDVPYRIAKDFPFFTGASGAAIPSITAIDTVYPGPSENGAYIIRDFKVVGGE